MLPVATLRALVKVERFPEEMTKLRAFDAQLHRIAESDPTARLAATVEQHGFTEFTALVDDAKGKSASARLGADVSKGEFATAAAEITALRDLSDKSIVQSVKVELDKESAAAIEAEKAALGGSSGRPGVSGAGQLTAEQISNDMLGLRQWQLAHPNFWNVGPKTSALTVGADAAAAAPNGPESSVDTSALLAEAASDTAAKTVARVQRAAETMATQSAPLSAQGNYDRVLADAIERARKRGVPSTVVNRVAKGDPEVIAARAAVDAEKAAAADTAAGGRGGKGGGGGGSGGFWGTLLGDAAGGDGESTAHKLLWGKGKWGFAGFGSLASFAGFGLEHALLTSGGLAGSAATALVGGGGLLAAGGLGKLAVGSGSDALVMHSTLKGIETLYEGWKEVEKVQAEYGKGSKQAVSAEKSFKQTMEGVGGAKSVDAELRVAKQVGDLKHVWDGATEEAKSDATKILSQVVGVADAYVPLVAHAAETNFTLIDKGLRPLFSWLKGPEGMGVFDQLEKEFAEQLPTGLHAVDQGVEFLLKTMADASKYTGGFTESLDAFFTKWNSPQYFAQWEVEIGKLIGDFRLWSTLVKVLGSDLGALFSNDAGSAQAIVKELTGMLEKLGEWERSTSGKEDLHNIFTVHKEEALALLKVLPSLVSSFGSIYSTIAPPLVESVTGLAEGLAWVLKEVDALGPAARDSLGVLLVMTKLFGLKNVFGAFAEATGAKSAISGLAKSTIDYLPVSEAAKERMYGMVTATDAQTAATDRLVAAQDRLAASMDRVATGGAATDATAAEGAVGAGTDAAAGAGAGEDAAESTAKGGLIGGILGSNFATAGAVAGGYFATEFGVKAIEGITGSHILEGQSLWKSLFHGFNTEHVAEIEAHAFARQFAAEIRNALSAGGSATALESASHNRARTIEKPQTDAIRGEAEVLGRLKSGYVTELAQIEKLARKGAADAAVAFGEGSPEWRLAAADNMHAAVAAIEKGEQEGLISARDGQKAIASLLHNERVVTGNDPFGIARSFVRSWEEAGGANRQGIAKAMGELRQMPPQMQGIAIQMMLQQVKHAEETGQLTKGAYARMRSAVVADFGVMALKGGQEAEALGMKVVGAFGGMTPLVNEALEAIGGNTDSVLKALGAATLPSFHLSAGQHLVKESPSVKGVWSAVAEKQRGGHIAEGAPAGDTVPAMLERGEYVLNRNAVAAIGTDHLDAVNFGTASRFQKGGQAGRLVEPQILGGAGAIHDIGQSAVHKAYEAADRLISRHKATSTAGSAGIDLSGIEGTRFQIGATELKRIGAPHIIALALFEALLAEGGPFSNVLEGEGAGVGAPIMSAAKEIAGFLTGTPRWTGTSAMSLANSGQKAYEIAQDVQASGAGLASHGLANYGAQESAAEALLGRFGLAEGARSPRRTGAAAADAHHHGFALGGLVESIPTSTGWEPGSVTKGGSSSPSSPKYKPKTNAQYEKERDHKSAEGAIHWEMSHIGQSEPWNSQNPDEWCGDFQAAGMLAIGLEPPHPYSAAIDWAHFGKPLGKGAIQGGAEIVYGEQHVAMALDSSRMISGNWGGVVATSPIEESVKGTPITAVRWPPYAEAAGAGSELHAHIPKVVVGKYVTHKKGSTSKGGGTYAESTYGHYKVYTASLHLPSGEPKSLPECEREITERRHQLQEYRAAAKQSKDSPKAQQAIEANVRALEARLRVLFHARTKLRRKKAETRYSKGLSAKLSGLTGYQDKVAEAERDYNELNQFASQIVSLEPLAPEFAAAATEAEREAGEKAYVQQFAAYVEGQERPAYEAVLGAEAAWRNTILGGESKATGLERGWEAQVRQVDAQIAKINKFSSSHPASWWHESKHEAALKKRESLRAQLPMLRFKDTELRKVLGEARGDFWPGIGNGHEAITPPVPPMPGSGSFEEALIGVQGIHWPGEHSPIAGLPGNPVAGLFGGAIWETQEAFAGLGLKIKQAGAGIGAGSSATEEAMKTEREGLLEELLRQSNEAQVVRNIEVSTLSGGLPYAGAYASGGMVAAVVGETGPEVIATRPGAYIHNASESSSMLSPSVEVHVHGDIHSDHPDPVQVILNDERVTAKIRQVSGHDDRRGARRAARGFRPAGS